MHTCTHTQTHAYTLIFIYFLYFSFRSVLIDYKIELLSDIWSRIAVIGFMVDLSFASLTILVGPLVNWLGTQEVLVFSLSTMICFN